MTEEERREKKKLYNMRYRSKPEGKDKTYEAIRKYQQTDKYKQSKKLYYEKKKQEKRAKIEELNKIINK